MNPEKDKFKVGDKVRLKLGRSHEKGPRKVARIESFYSDIEGGVRLDRILAEYYSWNVEDLEKLGDPK